jgi:hypothetical protein
VALVNVKCPMSNVKLVLSNDQITNLPKSGQWVNGSFDKTNLTFDMGHSTFDILETDATILTLFAT